MTAKVRVLLDVDGVLNAVTKKPDPNQWDDWRVVKCYGFPITFSPTVVEFFNRLASDPLVDLRWLTTWEELANKYISPGLGIAELPVCSSSTTEPSGIQVVKTTSKSGWWKFDIARELYESDELPFVWIDDDLGDRYDDGAAEWVKSLNGRGLGIRPASERGLTRRLLREIESFVARCLEEVQSV